MDELQPGGSNNCTPDEILDLAWQQVQTNPNDPALRDPVLVQQVAYVTRNIKNRAGVRLLLACSLAKVHRPEVDIRKPYTEITGGDTFSGRYYDEQFVTRFILRYELPCNPTTAFLTPALRNHNSMLEIGIDLVGRPAKLYQVVLELLDAVHQGHITANELLVETVRWLVIVRDEQRQRIQSLIESLNAASGDIPLSAEAVTELVEQHLRQPNSSRLPVLVVAAAYQCAGHTAGQQLRPLQSHTAADFQTQALGDLEITLENADQIVTSYEMKTRVVTHDDINQALQKIRQRGQYVNHYVFITTQPIDADVANYAAGLYEQTQGIEIVILDCISFLRHFLHWFHNLRLEFLEHYQTLVLQEPLSAVNQPLKEVLLTLRQAAEVRES